ncbi:hypothetical protein H5410_005527 [Solanum commersonii]|uniref:Uncharacterized protein n=1 Tax=Solanum commersonii TaxID=4109 RepID=A0A9J6A6V2_SOLCO|nr:hypothetical protein H5410_005527 [Solanum commersonii]
MNSSTVVAQVSEIQLQHVPRESPTVEAHDIQYQVQQETQNSKENDLSGELGPVTQKRKRGSIVMQSVHGRQERKLVVLNRCNQPISPTNAVVTELGSFLGTLARNAMLCPLNIHNWKNMDTKKDLWDYTQNKLEEKYDISDSAKNWALEGIKNARRKYRNDLYENHYKAYDNDDLRMENKPKDVSEFDFKDLLKYWDSEKFKEMSERNTKKKKDESTYCWKKRRKASMSCQLKNSLWLQDQENLVEYTRTPTKIQLVKLLKWRKCKVDRMKMTINHLMLLQQSWDMNTQGA